MPTKKLIIFVIILFASFSQFVLAKTNNNKSELTVEADDSLELFEKEKNYLEKGNVILKKDFVTLKANTDKWVISDFAEYLTISLNRFTPCL